MTRVRALSRFVFGSRGTIAGTVYGTIVVLAVLAAGGKAFEHSLWRLIAIVVTTVLVLWLAHVYAHGLGESLHMGRRPGGPRIALTRYLAKRVGALVRFG